MEQTKLSKIKTKLHLAAYSDMPDPLRMYFTTRLRLTWLLIIPFIILAFILKSLNSVLLGVGLTVVLYMALVLNIMYVLQGKCGIIEGVVVTSVEGNKRSLVRAALSSSLRGQQFQQRPYIDVVTEEGSRVRVFVKGPNSYEVGNEIKVYALLSDIEVKTEDYGAINNYYLIKLEKYN
jgi:hypothetical protein